MVRSPHAVRACSLVLLLTVLLSATGCASWRPIEPTPGAVPRTYQAGEVLRLTLRDGNRIEFRVRTVTGDTLFGSLRYRPDSPLAIARSTVVRTEQYQAREGATIGVVLGGLAAVGLAVGIMAIASCCD